jgi:5-methyltetrahydropteroyltriglutamate--homocysteine methyltransferase
MMAAPLFPASVVGSLPRPQFVRDLLEQHRLADIDNATFDKQMDAAVAFAVAMQEEAGLDVISDGEWRRWSYIGVIADLCSGFAFEIRDGRSWHTVVEPLGDRRPGSVAREVAFVKSCTQKQVKVCLPSPYLLGQRMWDAEQSDKAYPTRASFMEAVVPYLHEELTRVFDAGADVVQFDDPHICLFVDPNVQRQFDDWHSEIALGVDLLNQVVAEMDGRATAIHL